MKRLYFGAAYTATLVVPALLYLSAFGGGSAPYSLSILFGTVAFAIFADQFLLASKPRWAVEALGTKGLLSFHGTMAAVGLVVAFAHRALKVGILKGGAEADEGLRSAFLYGLGFSDETVQAGLGGIAFALFIIAVLFAAFLMANTFWMKIPFFKKVKDSVYGSLKLNYHRMRGVHNVVAVAFGLILAHILLASSSNFQANPLGVSWMVLWSAFCVGSYVRYRIGGRKVPVKRTVASQA